MTRPQQRARSDLGLRWFDSLQFKLGLMFLLLLVLLGAASFYASDRLVGSGLDVASFRYETEVSRRLSAQIEATTREARDLANTIALIARDSRIAKTIQKSTIESAAAAVPGDSPIIAFGYWPEPASTTAGAARDSLAWVRDGTGRWAQRADYNDPNTIPYWRESWYTPARLAGAAHCYWTARYRDLLTRRDVISCVLPLLGTRGFEGAVTVSLALDALGARFTMQTADDSGYALLIDRDGQVLALSKRARDQLGGTLNLGRNIAELAQKQPPLNPLVLAVHARNEAFFADALRSSLYDARQVSQLKDNSRELSRGEADSALAAIWNRAAGRTPAQSQTLRQPADPVLGETGYAVLTSLAETDWQLASVTPTREGQDSARYLITQALVVTLGAVALTLLLAFFVLRGTVVRPLRRMLAQLSAAQDQTATGLATLDQSARNELGALAHWFNEHGGQIRELAMRTQSMSGQLALETAERQRAQDALSRVQERSHLALSTIDDGVVTIDERGHIEDMNPVAEQLLGVSLRTVRGTPFAQSFQARTADNSGAALPSPTELALERGSRIEYPDGVFLTGKDLAEREIYLAVAPLRSRNGRAMGCVIVLRRLSARLASPPANNLEPPPHPVTGLGSRGACERRVRSLLDSARIGVRQHALLVVEIGALGEGSDKELRQSRLAELFGAWAGGSEQVFGLPGDRYAITLEQLEAAQALERGRELIERLARSFELSGQDIETFVGGIGICPIDAALANAMEAIRRAGAACDAALRGTGSEHRALLYEPAHDLAGAGNDDPIWVQRIRRGLDQNLFHLTTQWIAPARSRAAEGQVFEVLVALEDEEGFWTSPEQFLPVAERHQLAGEIDRWVVRRVLESLAANPGLVSRILLCSIKLSNASIGDPGFLDFLAEQLNVNPQLPIGKLCFEVGDERVSANPRAALRFCEALRAIGCRVAIEQREARQFTSIEQLRRLPIEFLKLDAKRFPRIAEDPVEQTIAESSLQLAKLLNQRTIVTRIDNEAIATIWRRLGADYLQGYAIAKPSPVPFTGV